VDVSILLILSSLLLLEFVLVIYLGHHYSNRM
jgi:hypothetical protein